MQLSEQGRGLIARFEGFSPMPYRCPAGVLTVGFGHVVREGERWEHPLSHAQAEQVLAQDVQAAERAVACYIHVPLEQSQFDALVSFTFNVGAAALQRSTLRAVVNRGEHAEAPQQFLRWIYAKGRPLKGLVARREAEAALYIS